MSTLSGLGLDAVHAIGRDLVLEGMGMIRAKLAAVVLAFLSQQAFAQSPALKAIRDAYVNCVNNSFYFTHLNDWIRDNNIQAAVERSFSDCRTEENALYSTAANIMMLSTWPAEQSAMYARSTVDRLKVTIKSRLSAGLENAPTSRARK